MSIDFSITIEVDKVVINFFKNNKQNKVFYYNFNPLMKPKSDF